MMVIGLIILAAWAAAVEWVMLVLVSPMLERGGASRPNYKGKIIPVAVGITFPLAFLVSFLPYPLLVGNDQEVLLFLSGASVMSLLGLADDLLGNRDTLGFRGHIGSLLKGRLTTGGLKLLAGGFLALFVSLYVHQSRWYNEWYLWLVDALVIALFTNFINLLDLRPGRAIKGFLIFLLPVILLAANRNWWLVIPVIAVVLVYFPWDLKARAMMGDAGSNVLGFTLGFLSVYHLSPYGRVLALVFLLAVQTAAERISLSSIIERVPPLRFIDNLGRESNRDDFRKETDR